MVQLFYMFHSKSCILGLDCKRYSLNNTGPCINGGKLTCRGEEVAPEIACQCPQNYEGKFCEVKIENVQ